MYPACRVRALTGFRWVNNPAVIWTVDTCSRLSHHIRNPVPPWGGFVKTRTRAVSSVPGHAFRNRLGLEKSPYLLQHASNPVDWYPWGPEAFAKARKEDKPIFLSVGYSTCHWCHVMARESFESEEIGRVMNQYFVNIKVDREERPDVDKVHMNFLHASTGSGGWPMSIWLTPDLKPIIGGTYFAPDERYHGRPGFKSILEQIAQKWREERSQMDEQGTVVVDSLMRKANSQLPMCTEKVDNIKCVPTCFSVLQNNYDEEYGGIGSKLKFPQPANFKFLLRMYAENPSGLENKVALRMTTDTLQSMAKGGIHDHINYGFHRYSTDRQWHVPHFEKMLYDQAQLAVLYAETYQVTKNPLFAEVTRGILDYVSRDLTDPNGGFYSAEDADSLADVDHAVKKEGAFCVWHWDELTELLRGQVPGHEQLTHADVFIHHYGVKRDGNTDPLQDPHGQLEGQNVLIVKGSVEETADRFHLTVEETKTLLEKCRAMLFEVRKKRPPPHLDTKMITAWNGLMISGFAKAGQILDEQAYLESATRAALFVKSHMYHEDIGVLLRSSYAGDNDAVHQIETPIQGFADDYAFLIRGLLDLYEGTLEDAWLVWAERLQETQDDLFWDKEGGGYFSTGAADVSIIMRMKDDHDGAEPSANSVSAANLLRLSHLLDRPEWREQACGVFGAFCDQLDNHPVAVPEMVCAHMLLQAAPRQIVIAGDRCAADTRALLQCVHAHFLPTTGLLLADGDVDGLLYSRLSVVPTLLRLNGKATAYVCENYACSLPVNTVAELEELLVD